MPSRSKYVTSDETIAKVQHVYTALENLPIERNCQSLAGCCHFKATGLMPFVSKGEALLAARALRATGRSKLPTRSDGACPLLIPGAETCLIYEDRPFACRTHFCKAAGGPYERKQVVYLIHTLEETNGAEGSRGSAPLPIAVIKALAQL